MTDADGARPLRPGGGVWLAFALVVVPVFLAHASLYDHWLVDDAGISFAYARNWARGHGLVAQPGAEPLEGYSNPLWVLLCAVLHGLGWFPIPLAPKLLGKGLALAALGLLPLLGARLGGGRDRDGVLAALACALCPAFVIWCVSGLENPLLAFLILLLVWLVTGGPPSPRRALVAGGTAALVAMTRPDGLVYAPLAPLLWWAWPRATRDAEGTRPEAWPAARDGVRAYLLGFGVPWGAFMLHRLATFGALVPNTYHAKGGPGVMEALEVLLLHPDRVDLAQELAAAGFGVALGNLVLVLVVALAVRTARNGELGARRGALLTFTAVAMAIHLVMPRDWMGEVRFATPFFPLVWLTGLDLLRVWLERLELRSPARMRLLFWLAVVSLAAPDFRGRAVRFARQPTISLGFVRRAFAERFDRWARELGVEDGRILLPDVGAMLLWSELEVYDLYGLCDRTIGRNLERDPAAIRDYVFEEVRPFALHLNHKLAHRLRFADDPRFRDLYVPVHLYPPMGGYEVEGVLPGYWLRRDLAERHPKVYEAIRARPQGYDAFWRDPPPSALRDWLATLASDDAGRTPGPEASEGSPASGAPEGEV